MRTIEALVGNNMTGEQRKKLAEAQRQLEQATIEANSPSAVQNRARLITEMERDLARMPPDKQAVMREQITKLQGGAGTMESTVTDVTERLTLTSATCPAGM